MRPLRFAIVGLGHIAQKAVLPAFATAKGYAELAALVSSDGVKLRELGERHGVPEERRFDYDGYDECLSRDDVDAVYVALPNAQHEDYTLRAARAGKHVLCEKPMALSPAQCRRMIEACEDAGVSLMIAYRLHYEAANLRAIELVEEGRIGEPRFFASEFGYQVKDGDIRTSGELGGGPLWDLGVYCINAARYLFRDEPEEVYAVRDGGGDDDRFEEVERSLTAVLRFPGDRVATFTTSFGVAPVDGYRLIGTEGTIRVEPAYEYEGELKLYLTVDEETTCETFGPSDQFAPELIRFAECVREGRSPEPDGYEGLADVRIVCCLRESARRGEPVELEDFDPRSRPVPSQQLDRPPPPDADEVHTSSPHE